MDQPINDQPNFARNLRDLIKRAINSPWVQQVGENIAHDLPYVLHPQAMSASQLQELSDGLKQQTTYLIAVCRREREALGGRNGRDQAVLEMAVAQIEAVTGQLEDMLGIYADALQHSDPRMAAIQIDNSIMPMHRSGAGAVPAHLSGGQRRHLSEHLRNVLANAIAMATLPGPANGLHPASAYATAGAIRQMRGVADWLRQSLDRCYEDLRSGAK